MPCPFALAATRVPGRRWATRAERLAILNAVRERIAASDSASLAELAREAGLSPYHLQRLFTAAYGESPAAMALRLRAERGAELLAWGATPAQVAARLGYSEPSAFSRGFRRRYGVSPGGFRKVGQPGGSGGAAH